MNSEEMREALKANMAEYLKLALIDRESRKAANERMSAFLKPRSDLADVALMLELEIADLISLRDAAYGKAIASAEGSNAEKQKAAAKADPEYSAACKEIAQNEAVLNYVKAHIKIFEDATFNFRKLAEGNNSGF